MEQHASEASAVLEQKEESLTIEAALSKHLNQYREQDGRLNVETFEDAFPELIAVASDPIAMASYGRHNRPFITPPYILFDGNPGQANITLSESSYHGLQSGRNPISQGSILDQHGVKIPGILDCALMEFAEDPTSIAKYMFAGFPVICINGPQHLAGKTFEYGDPEITHELNAHFAEFPGDQPRFIVNSSILQIVRAFEARGFTKGVQRQAPQREKEGATDIFKALVKQGRSCAAADYIPQVEFALSQLKTAAEKINTLKDLIQVLRDVNRHEEALVHANQLNKLIPQQKLAEKLHVTQLITRIHRDCVRGKRGDAAKQEARSNAVNCALTMLQGQKILQPLFDVLQMDKHGAKRPHDDGARILRDSLDAFPTNIKISLCNLFENIYWAQKDYVDQLGSGCPDIQKQKLKCISDLYHGAVSGFTLDRNSNKADECILRFLQARMYFSLKKRDPKNLVTARQLIVEALGQMPDDFHLTHPEVCPELPIQAAATFNELTENEIDALNRGPLSLNELIVINLERGQEYDPLIYDHVQAAVNKLKSCLDLLPTVPLHTRNRLLEHWSRLQVLLGDYEPAYRLAFSAAKAKEEGGGKDAANNPLWISATITAAKMLSLPKVQKDPHHKAHWQTKVNAAYAKTISSTKISPNDKRNFGNLINMIRLVKGPEHRILEVAAHWIRQMPSTDAANALEVLQGQLQQSSAFANCKLLQALAFFIGGPEGELNKIIRDARVRAYPERPISVMNAADFYPAMVYHSLASYSQTPLLPKDADLPTQVQYLYSQAYDKELIKDVAAMLPTIGNPEFPSLYNLLSGLKQLEQQGWHTFYVSNLKSKIDECVRKLCREEFGAALGKSRAFELCVTEYVPPAVAAHADVAAMEDEEKHDRRKEQDPDDLAAINALIAAQEAREAQAKTEAAEKQAAERKQEFGPGTAMGSVAAAAGSPAKRPKTGSDSPTPMEDGQHEKPTYPYVEEGGRRWDAEMMLVEHYSLEHIDDWQGDVSLRLILERARDNADAFAIDLSTAIKEGRVSIKTVEENIRYLQGHYSLSAFASVFQQALDAHNNPRAMHEKPTYPYVDKMERRWDAEQLCSEYMIEALEYCVEKRCPLSHDERRGLLAANSNSEQFTQDFSNALHERRISRENIQTVIGLLQGTGNQQFKPLFQQALDAHNNPRAMHEKPTYPHVTKRGARWDAEAMLGGYCGLGYVEQLWGMDLLRSMLEHARDNADAFAIDLSTAIQEGRVSTKTAEENIRYIKEHDSLQAFASVFQQALDAHNNPRAMPHAARQQQQQSAAAVPRLLVRGGSKPSMQELDQMLAQAFTPNAGNGYAPEAFLEHIQMLHQHLRGMAINKTQKSHLQRLDALRRELGDDSRANQPQPQSQAAATAGTFFVPPQQQQQPLQQSQAAAMPASRLEQQNLHAADPNFPELLVPNGPVPDGAKLEQMLLQLEEAAKGAIKLHPDLQAFKIHVKQLRDLYAGPQIPGVSYVFFTKKRRGEAFNSLIAQCDQQLAQAQQQPSQSYAATLGALGRAAQQQPPHNLRTDDPNFPELLVPGGPALPASQLENMLLQVEQAAQGKIKPPADKQAFRTHLNHLEQLYKNGGIASGMDRRCFKQTERLNAFKTLRAWCNGDESAIQHQQPPQHAGFARQFSAPVPQQQEDYSPPNGRDSYDDKGGKNATNEYIH